MGRKLTYIKLAAALMVCLYLAQPVFSEVQILGSWVTGTSHAKEAGSNRALIFIAQAEYGSSPNLSGVTYDGRPMTKIIDRVQSGYTYAYTVAYRLEEADIDAATSGTFVPTWTGSTPTNVEYISVFLDGVNQTAPIGASASASNTSGTTLSTAALATQNGDMVIDAATCSSSGAFNVTGGFTEAREGGSTAYDCVDGYKAATGASETPSVTHSASFSRKTLIGFVVQVRIDPNKASNPSPGNGANGVLPSVSLSWDAPTAYMPSSYDVYFGTNSTAHSNPKHTVYTDSYNPPGDLLEGTTYYWAVDSNDSSTIHPGFDWSFTTSTPVGDRIANYIISVPLEDHYASACSYYGVLLYSELTGDTGLKNNVIDAYPPAYYNGTDTPDGDGSQDRNAYGILPFELYRQTSDANYLTLAVYLADEEFENPRSDGLANSHYTRFWIDDLYMIGSLQAQAYKSMGDITYANNATVQLLGYMGEVEQLQQSNGLFHHTTSVPIYWGRGNGWGAAAMTEVLLAIPEDDPNRPSLLSKYQAMMAGLVNYQDASGMWYQVLDMGSDPRNWVETSCTGMFVFALATGVKQGWLPEVPYKQAALDGWAALENYIDEQGRVHEVCKWVSANPDVNYYFDREREIGNAHGQAAAIWAATAIERLNCEAEIVDFDDLKILADNWLGDEPAADIFPPGGDGIVNFLDFAELAKDWLK